MLAQNLKTPSALGITEVEFDALHKTLGFLEREDLPGRLDLQLWCVESECGTRACIAGWAWLFSDKRAFVDVVGESGMGGAEGWFEKRPLGLQNLFLSIRRPEASAAIALRNYLTHGEPRWEEAMAG